MGNTGQLSSDTVLDGSLGDKRAVSQKGWFWRMYPRSSFRSGGACEGTLVPVLVRGEHPNVPLVSGFRSGGSSAKTTLLLRVVSPTFRLSINYCVFDRVKLIETDYPRSGFRSRGTSECTLVPVFVPGDHPPKPPFC